MKILGDHLFTHEILQKTTENDGRKQMPSINLQVSPALPEKLRCDSRIWLSASNLLLLLKTDVY